MPPTDIRRRRRRRLSRAGAVVLVAAIVMVLVALVVAGGIVKSGQESTSFWRDVDSSYAAQARVVVRQSNQVDTSLESVVHGMAGDSRGRLEASLDTLVRASADLARVAATLSTPPPARGVGDEVAHAMADRATALRDLRRTIDGLLGMAPLPVPGSPTRARNASRVVLDAAAAASGLEHVSTLLEDADRLYASARRALTRAPGLARLPASVWMHGTVVWSSGGAQSVVAALVASPTLAAVHDVVLVPHALVLTPAPVPPGPATATSAASPAGSSGALRLPPTKKVLLTAIVADDGNVTERGVEVEVRAQMVGGDTTVRRSRRVSVDAHGTASVTMPALYVVPSQSYTVTVEVVPSVPDPSGAVTTDTLSISVAPPAPGTVVQLTPSRGRPKGGTAVSIVGTGFTWVTAVDFGSTPARFKVVSSTRITAVSPPGTGTVTVTVMNSGGPSSPANATAAHFTYKRLSHRRSSG